MRNTLSIVQSKRILHNTLSQSIVQSHRVLHNIWNVLIYLFVVKYLKEVSYRYFFLIFLIDWVYCLNSGNMHYIYIYISKFQKTLQNLFIGPLLKIFRKIWKYHNIIHNTNNLQKCRYCIISENIVQSQRILCHLIEYYTIAESLVQSHRLLRNLTGYCPILRSEMYI